MSSRFTQVVANGRCPLRLDDARLPECAVPRMWLPTCSSMDTWVAPVRLLSWLMLVRARADRALADPAFSGLGFAPTSGVWGHTAVLFLVLWRTLHTGLHGGCTGLRPTGHADSPFSASPPTPVVSHLSGSSRLTGVRRYLVLVLICISLVLSGLEHLLVGLLAILACLETCLFNFFARS